MGGLRLAQGLGLQDLARGAVAFGCLGFGAGLAEAVAAEDAQESTTRGKSQTFVNTRPAASLKAVNACNLCSCS